MANLANRLGFLNVNNSKHLLSSTIFNCNKSNILIFSNYDASDAVDLLFNISNYSQEPLANDTNQVWIPTYQNSNVIPSGMNDTECFISIFSWWLTRSKKTDFINSKLELFFHSIYIINFVDNVGIYNFGYDYFKLLEFYSTGSIKQLAKKISRLNAMHFYLNNNLNVVGSPNENYAREFLELFTIGKGPQDGVGSYTNYTEQDVQQAARVLTGFTNINENERLNYLDTECHIPLGKKIFANHDTGNKTFSAKFGNQTIIGATSEAEMDVELDEFIDMVFAQPETAKNYARRLYRYFVRRAINVEIEADIILPLANNLLATEYNIESTVKMLLKSIHFYDEDDSTVGDEIIGSKVKSPLELALIMVNQFKIELPTPLNSVADFNNFYYYIIWFFCDKCNFQLFRPSTVAGYPAYYEAPEYDRLWINPVTLKSRYNDLINPLLIGVVTGSTITKFNIVDYVQNSGDYSNPSNAITLINEFLELCFCSMPTGDRYNYFKQALLGNLSIINWQHEWNNYVTTGNNNSVKVALERFVRAVVQSPEYQLF